MLHFACANAPGRNLVGIGTVCRGCAGAHAAVFWHSPVAAAAGRVWRLRPVAVSSDRQRHRPLVQRPPETPRRQEPRRRRWLRGWPHRPLRALASANMRSCIAICSASDSPCASAFVFLLILGATCRAASSIEMFVAEVSRTTCAPLLAFELRCAPHPAAPC